MRPESHALQCGRQFCDPARMLVEKDFDSDAVKVVTNRGTVYLMGILSRKEAAIATEIARTTEGAHRVVKLFEYLD